MAEHAKSTKIMQASALPESHTCPFSSEGLTFLQLVQHHNSRSESAAADDAQNSQFWVNEVAPYLDLNAGWPYSRSSTVTSEEFHTDYASSTENRSMLRLGPKFSTSSLRTPMTDDSPRGVPWIHGAEESTIDSLPCPRAQDCEDHQDLGASDVWKYIPYEPPSSTASTSPLDSEPSTSESAWAKKIRRREQNRRAQRTYRARKDQAALDLLQQISRLEAEMKTLRQTNKSLVRQLAQYPTV